MRQDDYRDQIATVIADLGITGRTERVRLYRFARGLLRLGLTDLAVPRDRRGRTQSLLDLEGAIRDTEGAAARRTASAPPAFLPDWSDAARAGAPWPGLGRVLATLVTRNIRMMLAKDPLAYLWLFLAPILTIAAVLGSKLR